MKCLKGIPDRYVHCENTKAKAQTTTCPMKTFALTAASLQSLWSSPTGNECRSVHFRYRKRGLRKGRLNTQRAEQPTLNFEDNLPVSNASCGTDQTEAPGAAATPAVALASQLQFPPDFYDEQGLLVLKNLTLLQLEDWCESIGESRKRGMQLWRWMYYDCNWIRSLDDAPAGVVQNGFGAAFREKMRGLATVEGGLELVSVRKSSDGTRKMVFRLAHGPGAGGQVETVLIPIVREQGLKPRITLCVSSQVGCAMNCQFCYTGRMGLRGNLTAAQIVEQVVAARRLVYEEEVEEGLGRRKHITPITNIVYMGMGEPLHNLPAVLPSIDIMCHPMGLHLSYNKVTVSTVGLVEEMRQFAATSRAVMAVSLHATTDEVRDWIVPVNRKHGLQELLRTMAELFPRDRAAPRHGAHVLIEYTMLRGVNDTVEDAHRLLEIAKGIRCKINLIVFNPHEGTLFQPSTREAVAAFRSVLIQGGHVATVRDSRGDDEMAACGQLGSPGQGAGATGGATRSPPVPPLLPPPERLRPVLAGMAGGSSSEH